MTVKWRHCAIAERDHRKDVRNYAHTFHYPQTICLAKDFWKLPREYRDGIILHEIGHLIAGPDGSEDDANEAVFDWAGAQIDYVDSPFGKRLERLSNMAGARIARRRRNPIANEDHLPYDQWIPSHAVKFNSDGTVDLMTEGHVANAGMVQNIQGYKDAAGHFHPIRWDSDYDTSELTDPEPRDYTISPSRKFYSMSGETPPRSRKRRRRR